MHPNALLELAAELIAAVNKLDAPADATVSAFFRHHKNLGQRERASIAETVYAMLRERLKFQNLAQSGSGPVARRLAILAWRGSPTFLRGALSPQEQLWLD
ncbi:MAG: SAM-dependent methyltransferase, partial [Rubrivivax sp.]